jgi:hypothetical protein
MCDRLLTPCLHVVLILLVGGSVNSLLVVIFMKTAYLKALLVTCIIYSFQYETALFDDKHAKRVPNYPTTPLYCHVSQ